VPLRPALLCRIALFAGLLNAPRVAVAEDDPGALMEDGHYKRARVAIEEREKHHPEDPATIFLRARYTLATGDSKAALPLAEKAADLVPGSAEYRYLVAQCVGNQAETAGKLHQLGLAKRFKREAEAALALNHKFLDAYEGLIEFYSRAPGIAGGNDKRALALADTFVMLDPVRGHLEKATLAFRDKHPDQAEENLRAAVRADSSSYPARMTLARFLAGDAQKKWDEAERHTRAALAAEPGRIGPYAVLAFLDAHLQRWDALDRTLAESEKAVPDNLGAYYQAGRTLIADDREPARAEKYFRHFLTQEPELGGGPTLAHAHWRLGQVLEKEGRKEEAIAETELALKLKPDLDDAKKDLKRMGK
jgi:tetratricopeptide (TPR) repeat protein